MTTTTTAHTIYLAKQKPDPVSPEGITLSPLDGRLPEISFREMRATGKSLARLRVEKGKNSIVDWLEVKVEDMVSKPGRDRE